MFEKVHQGLRISIPIAFRDEMLADLGKVQEALRTAKKGCVVELSFCECEWADPLPVLVLFVEIVRWRSSDAQSKLVVDLGVFGLADHSRRQARLRKFLHHHGFLEMLLRYASAEFIFDRHANGEAATFCTPSDYQVLAEVLVSQSPPLSYESAELIPADILTFDSSQIVQTELISQFVDKLVRIADRNLFFQRPSARGSRDTTLQRTRHILLELVRNSWEHAYRDVGRGAVAVFARVRDVNHGIKPHLIGKESHPTAQAEANHCPQTQAIRDRSDGTQIELFVCDVGKGLTADLQEWANASHLAQTEGKKQLQLILSSTEQRKYPLRHMDRMLFALPLSRHDRTAEEVLIQRGHLTGLQYLGHILGYHRDITRISVGAEWVTRVHDSGPAPRLPKYATSEGSDTFLGTVFHVALIVQQTPSLTDKGWTDLIEGDWTGYRAELVKQLAATSNAPLKSWPQTQVIDLRDRETSDLSEDSGGLREKISRSVSEMDDSPIVRTRRNFEKNLILPVLEGWLGSDAKNANDIVIADMSRFQCIAVDHVVRTLNRRYDVAPSSILQRRFILLMSEDFASKLYKVVTRRRENVFHTHIEHVPITPGAAHGLLKRHLRVLRQLRLVDSRAFWKNVLQLDQKQKGSVLLGPVLWAEGSVLPVYLNFSYAAHEVAIARIIRRSLRRMLALFPECRPEALDELIAPELHDATKWLPNQPPDTEDTPRIMVGSVFVSGSTVARQRQVFEFSVSAVLHALTAPTSSKRAENLGVPSLSALVWKETERPAVGSEIAYVRIPDTPYVAKHADLLLQTGRIHERDDVVATTPAEMYRSFYRDRLIKVGHWKYGSRHSLLDTNVVSVLEASADTDQGFYSWLSKRLVSIATSANVVVGYPVQRLAASIARTLEKKLPHSCPKERITWLPLHYMPSSNGSLIRLSPLTLDQLKGHMERAQEKDIHFCFLDVGVVSSKTFRHTRRQVQALGIRDFVGFVLQNRTSWPSLAEEIDSEISEGPNAYWRWGVPVFPNSSACAVCSGLAGIPQFVELIHRRLPDVASVVTSINLLWSAQDLADAWHETGLEPEPLEAAIQKKLGFADQKSSSLDRFNLVRDDKGRPVFWHLVEHESSTTLASHAIEVAAATHRLGYPLSLVKKKERSKKLSPTSALEVLVCTLLLLGKDMSLRQCRDYVAATVDSLFELNDLGTLNSSSIRNQRLIGLVAIAFMGVPAKVKRNVAQGVLLHLQKTNVTDPWIRAPIVMLTRDTGPEGGVYKCYQATLRAIFEGDRLPHSAAQRVISSLASNAIRIGLHKMTYREAWMRLHQLFGRGPAHMGLCMQTIIAAKNAQKKQDALIGATFGALAGHSIYRALFANAQDVGSVLASVQNLGLFTDFDMNLLRRGFERWAAPDPQDQLRYPVNPIDEYEFVVKDARQVFLKTLVRIEAGKPISTAFDGSDIANQLNWSDSSGKFNVSNSLPRCQQLTALIAEIVVNADKHGTATADPWNEGVGVSRKHWIKGSCESNVHGPQLLLEIRNADPKKEFNLNDSPKLQSEFLTEIGGSCTPRHTPASGSSPAYFSMEVRVPYLSAIEQIGESHD